MLPAVRATAQLDLSALREGARSGGGQRLRLRSMLVITEVMASVVLLVSAGLLMRALDRLRDVDPGFRAEDVLTMRTALPIPPYDTTARRAQFYSRVLASVRALPGVLNAAYVSGLPGATLDARLAVAHRFQATGFDAFKYHSAVSFDGIVNEMRVLRDGLGPDVKLMVDLHWKFTAQEAIQLVEQLMPYRPYFVEAPCQPEDIEGQAHVGAHIKVPLALGEEWRTVYVYRPRMERRSMSIIQPEMGHIGISQFMQICRMANAFHMKVIPHASIGIGIFQAASLQAAAALPNCPMHEYQHSIFDKNLRYVKTSMQCKNGVFDVPDGPGLGIEPHDDVWQFLRKKGSL